MQVKVIMLNYFRSFFFVVVLVFLSSCQSSSESDGYYRLHPEKISAALKQCQQKKQNLCQRLEAVQLEVMSLAIELQSSPQAFGAKILEMQASLLDLAQQLKQAQFKKESEEIESLQLKSNLLNARKDQYLAMVRWLESPGG